MNLFLLDYDPIKAARYHCDKHIVKMPLESAQVLSTVKRLYGDTDEQLYKITHVKHPLVKWTYDCIENYLFHYTFFIAMCHEYTLRYHKTHVAQIKLEHILKIPPSGMPSKTFTWPPLCMGETYHSNDPVFSYRVFYIMEKLRFTRWSKPASVPLWITDPQYHFYKKETM